MKVLVLGGSGFVSGTLARRARDAGHAVTVVTRGRRPVEAGLSAIVADRNDRPAFAAAITAAGGTWDLVADCIGFDPADAEQDLACFSGRAGHLAFISTDFVYDPARRGVPQSEEGFFCEGSDYGAQKRACERILEASGTKAPPWTVFRPCHIYGPGSLLGCLPFHGRDPDLLARLRKGETLRLADGGSFLQQPIFVRDLADLVLSCPGNSAATRRIFNAAGPDIVESHEYYRLIATELGVELKIEKVSVASCLAEQPDRTPFLCHRTYDLTRLRASGLKVPSTPLSTGLKEHVRSLLR
jgi:nucleoside-diphosphate-sugar epimerase